MESTLIESSTLGHNHSEIQDFDASENHAGGAEGTLIHCPNDSTFVLDDEEEPEVDEVNVSILSAPPIRNLIGTFDDMEEKLDIKKDGNAHPNSKLMRSPKDSSGGKGIRDESPNGIEEFPVVDMDNEERLMLANHIHPYAIKLNIPTFELHESLKLNLAQPVINRCSFYSVIHGVNKEVQDMASQDKNYNSTHEVKDEDSALVQAVNGPSQQSTNSQMEAVELAILDEEKFLLAAIANRNETEMSIRACPASFAEAIGEVEPSRSDVTGTTNGQTANPLQVLATSRTQLWKPSRSWWEAKSGKNPWIEPKLHNRRWRYLWPLIHYHKFLAKCIKKLKRNQIDVKTSLSPVSAFLREEVCAVSDHLAATSKFTSDEWMSGLPHFHGWVNHDTEVQQHLQTLVAQLPMRSLAEQTDVDSPLLRSQIDQSFLKAMAEAREQMKDGAQEQYSKRVEDTESLRDESQSGSSREVEQRGGRFNQMKSPRNKNNGNRTPGSGGKHRQQDRMVHMSSNRSYSGNWPAAENHMPPGPYPHHVPYNPYPGHHPNQYMPYGGWGISAEQQTMVSTEWGHPMNNMPYYNSWNGAPGRGQHFFPHDNASRGFNSVASVEGEFPDTYQLDQMSISEHNDFDLSSERDPNENPHYELENDIMQTPSKNRNERSMSSPYWGHLKHAAMAGIGTPSEGRQPKSAQDMNERGRWSNKKRGKSSGMKKAKPLLINSSYNYHQGMTVPPSPATQFLMSPQANYKAHAYFNAGNNNGGFSTPSKTKSRQTSLSSSQHEGSLLPPTNGGEKQRIQGKGRHL